MISAIMGRYYSDQKQESDSLKKIKTWELSQKGFFDGGWRSGTITWTNGWTDNKTSIGIQSSVHDEESYIRLTYTQTDRDTGEKKDFDHKYPLVTTPCHFGGRRYWFICSIYKSGIYCGKCVAVLYKGGDYFACRSCYELSYESKNESKRYKSDPAFQALHIGIKIDDLKSTIKRPYYKGKATKKQRLLNRLISRQLPQLISFNKLYRSKKYDK